MILRTLNITLRIRHFQNNLKKKKLHQNINRKIFISLQFFQRSKLNFNYFFKTLILNLNQNKSKQLNINFDLNVLKKSYKFSNFFLTFFQILIQLYNFINQFFFNFIKLFELKNNLFNFIKNFLIKFSVYQKINIYFSIFLKQFFFFLPFYTHLFSNYFNKINFVFINILLKFILLKNKLIKIKNLKSFFYILFNKYFSKFSNKINYKKQNNQRKIKNSFDRIIKKRLKFQFCKLKKFDRLKKLIKFEFQKYKKFKQLKKSKLIKYEKILRNNKIKKNCLYFVNFIFQKNYKFFWNKKIFNAITNNLSKKRKNKLSLLLKRKKKYFKFKKRILKFSHISKLKKIKYCLKKKNFSYLWKHKNNKKKKNKRKKKNFLRFLKLKKKMKLRYFFRLKKKKRIKKKLIFFFLKLKKKKKLIKFEKLKKLNRNKEIKKLKVKKIICNYNFLGLNQKLFFKMNFDKIKDLKNSDENTNNLILFFIFFFKLKFLFLTKFSVFSINHYYFEEKSDNLGLGFSKQSKTDLTLFNFNYLNFYDSFLQEIEKLQMHICAFVTFQPFFFIKNLYIFFFIYKFISYFKSLKINDLVLFQ